ncbi:hypothetical protein KM043_005227 [Ampulex compressa]|nr:hypothetical protein KM043_005227 [Ampulex compressa]
MNDDSSWQLFIHTTSSSSHDVYLLIELPTARILGPGEAPPISAAEEKRQETAGDFENLENDLRPLALGTRKNIGVGTYISGLGRGLDVSAVVKAPSRDPREFVESLKRRRTTREEFEWYKGCARRNLVVPYFRNIAGACFLWVKGRAEEAVELSRGNRSSAAVSLREGFNGLDIVDGPYPSSGRRLVKAQRGVWSSGRTTRETVRKYFRRGQEAKKNEQHFPNRSAAWAQRCTQGELNPLFNQ